MEVAGARANAASHYNLSARVHELEGCAEAQFSQQQLGLLSHIFTEANELWSISAKN